MFCSNCGKQVSENSTYCMNCGCAVSYSLNKTTPNFPDAGPVSNPGFVPKQELPVHKKKKIWPKVLISVSAVTVVLAVVAVVVGMKISDATENMREALRKNSGDAVYEVYESASSNRFLLRLYDDLISGKIDEIISRLDQYDGTAQVEVEGSDYMENKLGDWYGGLLGNEEHELADIVSGKANEKYSELETFWKSEFAYYSAIEQVALGDQLNYLDIDAYENKGYDYKAWHYSKALEYFSQVDSKASKYDEARKRMRTCSQSYINCVLKTANILIAEDCYLDAATELGKAIDVLAKYNIDAQAIIKLLEIIT